MLQSTESTLAQYLDPGERLLWSGQPRGGIRFRAHDAFFIPLSILWCGLAILWEVTVIATGAPYFFMLFGLLFVLIGLYMVVGRFFVDARSWARTFYGVTNERILIVSGLFTQGTKSLPLRTLTDVSLTQRGDGSGMITFGPAYFQTPFGPAWIAGFGPPAFDFIDRAKEVYEIIRNAQKAAPANA